MILSKAFYIKVSFIKRLWIKKQRNNLSKNSKLFFIGGWKNYHPVPRSKGIPKFIGSRNDLIEFRDAKKLEAMCPTGALEVTSNTILIDEKNCISCQECVKASPKGFFETTREKLGNDPETN